MSNLPINPDQFPSKGHFLIHGPAGLIEVLSLAPKKIEHEGVAIICHPHPLQEGAMTNKVVTTTAKAFENLGIRTIRFNFRGVGSSQGSFADTVGESDDLMAVIHWATHILQTKTLWLAGFSFGAYIAAHCSEKIQAQQLITIAPGIRNYPFHKIGAIHAPWLCIHGQEDEVADVEAVEDFFNTYVHNPIDLHIMPEAGHFFHGKLIELRTLLTESIHLPT